MSSFGDQKTPDITPGQGSSSPMPPGSQPLTFSTNSGEKGIQSTSSNALLELQGVGRQRSGPVSSIVMHHSQSLTGSNNYMVWKQRLKQLLIEHKAWVVIERGQGWNSLAEDQRREVNEIGLSAIIRNINDAAVRILGNISDAKVAWDRLANRYGGDEDMMANAKQGEFINLVMKDGQSAESYIDRFRQLYSDLEPTRWNVSEQFAIAQLLRSLPKRLNYFVLAIQNEQLQNGIMFPDRETMSLEYVLGRLLTEDRRLKLMDGKSLSERTGMVLLSQDGKSFHGTSGNTGRTGGYTGSFGGRKPNGGKFVKRFNKNIKCFGCGKVGHPVSKCDQRNKKDEKKSDGSQDKKENVVGNTSSSPGLEQKSENFSNSRNFRQNTSFNSLDRSNNPRVLIASAGSSAFSCMDNSTFNNEGYFSDNFIIDSGATCHISNSRELFIEYEESVNKIIRLGNGKVLKVEGEGKIKIEVQNPNEPGTIDRVFILEDVLHVPSMACNLLSVGAITFHGYNVVFWDTGCSVVDPRTNETLLTGTKNPNQSDLYILDGFVMDLELDPSWEPTWRPNQGYSRQDNFIFLASTEIENENKSENEKSEIKNKENTSLRLWHNRLGHVHGQALLDMVKKERVLGMKLNDNSKFDCEVCLENKITHLPFSSRE
jgi:hypothetical protein